MRMMTMLAFALMTALSILMAWQSNNQDVRVAPHSRPPVPSDGYVPHSGFVPTAAVAIQIAEAVLVPVYGSSVVTSERPFHAKLDGGVWIVKGTVPCAGAPPGAVCPGGNAEIWISKDDGKILYMIHSM